jgi:hypothetical protein
MSIDLKISKQMPSFSSTSLKIRSSMVLEFPTSKQQWHRHLFFVDDLIANRGAIASEALNYDETAIDACFQGICHSLGYGDNFQSN